MLRSARCMGALAALILTAAPAFAQGTLRIGMTASDIPLTTGIVVTYTTLFIVINVAIDVIYFLIDPRIRATQAG